MHDTFFNETMTFDGANPGFVMASDEFMTRNDFLCLVASHLAEPSSDLLKSIKAQPRPVYAWQIQSVT